VCLFNDKSLADFGHEIAMRPLFFYAGVFLIGSATLMLEIIQTRILSVVVWYHLAFFVISLAMFGLTAGAVWVYLHPVRFTEKTLPYDLSYFSGLFALATAICLAVQMTLAPVISAVTTTIWIWTELALCLSIPFFFAGVLMSLALTRSPFPVGWVYGVDLLGAATGCLGALLLLNLTDGPSAVLWVAVFVAGGALAFSASGSGKAPDEKPLLHACLRYRYWIFAILVVCALINPLTDHGLQPLAVKGKFEFPGSHLLRKWNSFSRVAVEPLKRGVPVMWGPSPKMFGNSWKVFQMDLNIDGDAGTTAYRFTGNFDDVGFLRYDVTNLAYFLAGRERAIIIGVGAGRDILSAALFGLKNITGVEINPVFVQLLTQEPQFANFTQIAALPGVQLVVDEGRSWMARTREFFDIVQMSLVDTWAATGAGAFTLSENGLYTVQAWKTFMSRLTPKGVLTVSRWYDPTVPDETGRIASLAVATLMEMGVTAPRNHVFLASQGTVATLVLSKSPLSASDVETLERAATEYQHDILMSPRQLPASDTLFRIITALDRKSLDSYTSSLAFDLTPPTDDRPFFFNQLPLSRPFQALAHAKNVLATGPVGGGVRQGNLVATIILLVLFFIALMFATAAIVVPLRPALKDVGFEVAMRGTLYFAFIGAGFMMVEIGLLQRMAVFLGHPIYSLSVLLFSLILTTGMGSFLSEKLALDRRAKIATWAILTGGYTMLLPFALSALFAAFNDATLTVRVAICVLSITPAGLLLGFGFPTGMRLISAIDSRPTPWLWGINGAAGVLAAISAIVVSLALGITATLIVGALCYFLLIPVSLSLIKQKPLVQPSPVKLSKKQAR
jgi:predicted membrane-bound spermidine synthase